MSETKTGESTATTGAPYPQDQAPVGFVQLVDHLNTLLISADAELSKEIHDEKRIGIYMSDINSISEDLRSQLPAKVRQVGPEDPTIVFLKHLLNGRLRLVVRKLEAHKSQLEGKKAALRRQYDVDMAALDDQLAEASKTSVVDDAVVDNLSPNEEDQSMSTPTREEIDAKLETIGVKMDGRVAAIQASIDGYLGRQEESAKRLEERLTRMESDSAQVRSEIKHNADRSSAEIKSLKATIIITAVSTVLAIVLGVAAFNATVLSNMLASFESGKNTAATQTDIKRQTEETVVLLKQIQERLDAQKAVSTRDDKPAEKK